ncbi:YoaK family protein [Streptomyces sp. NPDC093260]|uniref:YoaK family protein n=1 Tax=Streptomyces sp. NPDC093260 TaxID=3155073 RepID=UPI003448DAF5
MSERRSAHLPTAHSVRLGVLLALVGGGLDAYTYVGRGEVFANAQTGNVVLLGVAVAGRQWAEALRHIPPIVAFVLGVLVAESLKRPGVAARVRWPARAALVLEILVLFCVGLLPGGTADTAATVLVAFSASLQVAMFRTLVDTAYSTAMTTGNLRTATQSAYLAFIQRDRDAARRARRFSAVIGASWPVPSQVASLRTGRVSAPCGRLPASSRWGLFSSSTTNALPHGTAGPRRPKPEQAPRASAHVTRAQGIRESRPVRPVRTAPALTSPV